MVGARGVEPRTSSLSETRSNQLSYAPERNIQPKTRRIVLGFRLNAFDYILERVMGLEPITVCLEGRDSSH